MTVILSVVVTINSDWYVRFKEGSVGIQRNENLYVSVGVKKGFTGTMQTEEKLRKWI